MTNDHNYLEKIGKKMPYSMPEGLFERVQSNVLKRIDEMEEEKRLDAFKEQQQKNSQKQGKPKKTLIHRLTIAITAIAASVCAVCMVYFGNIGDGNGNSSHQLSKQQQATSTQAVDKAYDNLSQQEQQDLLADYSNDIYMSLQ